MRRKRLTEVFPFLLPLRIWQRKKCFYLKLKFDGNKYAKDIVTEKLPYKVFSVSSKMINENSGFDIKYQINKVHNLQLASKKVNNIIIKPGEIFSLCNLIKDADKNEPYKDGLNLVNGKIVGSYGGGLCQLSNVLFWEFLHSPLTIVERHSHRCEHFKPNDNEVVGVDATISEGWLDLKVKNETDARFQIKISFDDEYMNVALYSNKENRYKYDIFNKEVFYYEEDNKIYQSALVCQKTTDLSNMKSEEKVLYKNLCEIGYKLESNVKVKERLV